MTEPVFLRADSPLVFRSGVPFGSADAGGGGASLGFPLPGSTAGALRAAWCDAVGHRPQRHDPLHNAIRVRGPLRFTRHDTPGLSTLWLPRPADALSFRQGRHRAWQAARPLAADAGAGALPEGCDLPHGLLPVMADADVVPDDNTPDWWSLDAVEGWLLSPSYPMGPSAGDCRGPVPASLRTHAGIDPASRQVIDGALFQSAGLDLSTPAAAALDADEGLLCWVDDMPTPPDQAPDALHRHRGRLGADGRTVAYLLGNDIASLPPPECPDALAAALEAVEVGHTVRLMLVTPACYLRNGWYPDGLRPMPESAGGDTAGQRLSGSLAGLPDWHFELVAAAVGRPLAGAGMSMFDDEHGRPEVRPNALRRLAPAGSMYWLKVLARGSTPLASRCWQSTCYPEYARDGFGLGLFGLA